MSCIKGSNYQVDMVNAVLISFLDQLVGYRVVLLLEMKGNQFILGRILSFSGSIKLQSELIVILISVIVSVVSLRAIGNSIGEAKFKILNMDSNVTALF